MSFSSDMLFTRSLSVSKPNALRSTTNGISPGTYGKDILRKTPFLRGFLYSRFILALNPLFIDVTIALARLSSFSPIRSRIILLGAISSMVTIALSEPFTMKYPPGSWGSSPSASSSASFNPFKWHIFDFNITGISPIYTFSISCSSPPLIRDISRYICAE